MFPRGTQRTELTLVTGGKHSTPTQKEGNARPREAKAPGGN
jgi:hypothetical protein